MSCAGKFLPVNLILLVGLPGDVLAQLVELLDKLRLLLLLSMSFLNQLSDVLLNRVILLLDYCAHGLKLPFESGLELLKIHLWHCRLAWPIFDYG